MTFNWLSVPQACFLALGALPPAVGKSLLGVWFFALGGVVGSFLNVVIYRLPRGMRLSSPGSHCPACKRPVRWHDNVPVFGWILLGGRCRDCRAPISPRYPIVEALTACVFLAIGLSEVLFAGTNLPARPTPQADILAFPGGSGGALAAMAAYHLLLVCTLLPMALVEYDGHRVPARLVMPALVVGGLAPLVWPQLHPVPAWPDVSSWLAGLIDGTVGLAAGALLATVLRPLIGPDKSRGFLLALACVGLFLGWQAVAVLGTLSASGHMLCRALARPRLGLNAPTTCLALATLIWILAWQSILSRWPFWG